MCHIARPRPAPAPGLGVKLAPVPASHTIQPYCRTDCASYNSRQSSLAVVLTWQALPHQPAVKCPPYACLCVTELLSQSCAFRMQLVTRLLLLCLNGSSSPRGRLTRDLAAQCWYRRGERTLRHCHAHAAALSPSQRACCLRQPRAADSPRVVPPPRRKLGGRRRPWVLLRGLLVDSMTAV